MAPLRTRMLVRRLWVPLTALCGLALFAILAGLTHSKALLFGMPLCFAVAMGWSIRSFMREGRLRANVLVIALSACAISVVGMVVLTARLKG